MYFASPYLLGSANGDSAANAWGADYSSPGADNAGRAAWKAYKAQQLASLNAIQSQTNSLAGYSNSVDTNTAQNGTQPLNGYAPVFGPTPAPSPTSTGTAVGTAPLIGYNPSGNQGGPLTELQGYTNETPNGGGNLYAAPVAYGSGYLDFGSGYNAQTNPTDSFYYSDYDQALRGGNQAYLAYLTDANELGEVTGLAGTNGKISYGTAHTNTIAPTSTVGTMMGGLESDPTINGIDYTQGASYASLAAQGIGTQVPGGVGTPESGPRNGRVIPYTTATDPGNSFTQTAAGPTGIQTYNAQGQAITPSVPTNTPEGFGTPGTFYYGDNGSKGSISGVFSNNTPGQATDFYQNEPGSLTGAPGTPSLGTFSSQSANSATATPGPTDTASGYFTYGAPSGGVNEALGGINGYNPLGLDQTNQSTFSGTDSDLGYYGQVNPITGQNLANNNQTNPALQALQTFRGMN